MFSSSSPVAAQIGFTPSLFMQHNCGTVLNGHYASRIRYLHTTETDPSTCAANSETQQALCNNGKLMTWSGTYANDSCTNYRTMYLTGSTDCPTACTAETQTQSCTSGTCDTWTGSYTNASCTQNAVSQYMPIWVYQTHYNAYSCNPYQCNPYQCNCHTVSVTIRSGTINSTTCSTCYNTCYNTCYSSYQSCDASGNATNTCSSPVNTASGSYGGWSPNGSNYYSDSNCLVRY
jgi:hypothetical protein